MRRFVVTVSRALSEFFGAIVLRFTSASRSDAGWVVRRDNYADEHRYAKRRSKRRLPVRWPLGGLSHLRCPLDRAALALYGQNVLEKRDMPYP